MAVYMGRDPCPQEVVARASVIQSHPQLHECEAIRICDPVSKKNQKLYTQQKTINYHLAVLYNHYMSMRPVNQVHGFIINRKGKLALCRRSLYVDRGREYTHSSRTLETQLGGEFLSIVCQY